MYYNRVCSFRVCVTMLAVYRTTKPWISGRDSSSLISLVYEEISSKPGKWYSSLYFPTDAHNVKKRRVLKHFKIGKTAPTCFGLQGNRNMLEQFYLF